MFSMEQKLEFFLTVKLYVEFCDTFIFVLVSQNCNHDISHNCLKHFMMHEILRMRKLDYDNFPLIPNLP